MIASVDRDGCIGCTLCASVCPDVFFMANDGKASVCQTPVPPAMEGLAEDARDRCPVSVIDLNA